MTRFTLGGSAHQVISWANSEPNLNLVRNLYLTHSSTYRLTANADLFVDGWRYSEINYSGYFNYYSNPVSGTLNSMSLRTYDGYASFNSEDFSLPIERLLSADNTQSALDEILSGNDSLIGSRDGGSVYTRMLGGDDFVELHSGLLNDVNTNWGSDTIHLFGGGGRLRAGKDNDRIQIMGGQWQPVNGNNGDDIITNYSSFAGTVRGGKDNDFIENVGGGYFYGDLGSDIFKPWALDSYGNPIDGMMFIMDFQPGIDSLDLSGAGVVNFVYSEGDTLIGSTYTGNVIAVVENVIV